MDTSTLGQPKGSFHPYDQVDKIKLYKCCCMECKGWQESPESILGAWLRGWDPAVPALPQQLAISRGSSHPIYGQGHAGGQATGGHGS